MNYNLVNVLQIFNTKYNKDISVYDESFLLKSLVKRITANQFESNLEYETYLSVNSGEAQEFYESLNITYSEFFRNQLTFAMLEQVIFPTIIEENKNNGGEIRIWSSACSGGQESYSIAILLDELINQRGYDVNYRIFATDISEYELERAKCGIYDLSSLQQVRLKHLNKYFTCTNDSYQVIPVLKEKIEFSIYDMLDTSSSCPSISIYGDFDMIFCSNILFYYQPDIRLRMLNKVYYCMSGNGYFVTGEAEKDIVQKSDLFYPVLFSSPIFRRRKI